MPAILHKTQPTNITQFRAQARVHSHMALNVLVGIAGNKDCPPASRVAAAIHILERGWGKPEQQTTVTGADGGDITVIIRQIVEVPMKTIEHEEKIADISASDQT